MGKINVVAEPGQHSVQLSREFNAPRELVFKAFTDPTLVSKWWGLRSTTTVVDKMDAQMGGLWRYVEREANGDEYAFRGVYHDVTPPERLVYTFEFEGMPGHVLLETITLTEQDGKTLVTDLSVFQTVEARDGMVSMGMAEGSEQSWDQLEELLTTL